jgi:hypothetical protein
MRLRLRTALGIALQFILVSCSLVPTAAVETAHTTEPGATALPTTSSTFTPPETPVPIVRVSSGDRALFNGDYEAAVLEYSTAAENTTDSSIRAAALWGLARALFADERYDRHLHARRWLRTPDFYTPAARFLRQCLIANDA